ncbi:MAG: hypothetical protein ACRCVT_04410 [Leadbetterella sp.]
MKGKFFVLIAVLYSFGGWAQSKNQIRLELYKPINPFSYKNFTQNGFYFPKNIGFSAGIEHDYKVKKRRRIYQTLMVGYYNEVYFERVFTLESNLGISCRLFKGLNAGLEANLGYNRAQSSNLASYYENNKWVSKVDKSVKTNRLTAGLSANVGYDFSRHFGGKFPVSLHALVEGNILTPYLPDLNTPLGIMRYNKLMLKYRF